LSPESDFLGIAGDFNRRRVPTNGKLLHSHLQKR
jgi:hypothetical protein